MKNHFLIFVVFLLAFFHASLSQELPLIFKVADFDLRGNVKSCAVITDYGKEIFEFDQKGRLTKLVTRYNESDQDITVYKYKSGVLVEKRMESYKNGLLDAATSMANFYEFDTIANRVITEKIISYDKEFTEGQQYRFDKQGRLKNVLTSHLDAVDETTIEYNTYKNELTTTYFVNGTMEKSIRTSERVSKMGDTLKVTLTKEYIDGEPNKANEEVYRKDGHLYSETFFGYDSKEKQYVPLEIRAYAYNEENVLDNITTTRGKQASSKSYIFQFDSHIPKNWVKKIITPDNTYTTRIIEYYDSAEEEPVEE